jgi:hypothetical protein
MGCAFCSDAPRPTRKARASRRASPTTATRRPARFVRTVPGWSAPGSARARCGGRSTGATRWDPFASVAQAVAEIVKRAAVRVGLDRALCQPFASRWGWPPPAGRCAGMISLPGWAPAATVLRPSSLAAGTGAGRPRGELRARLAGQLELGWAALAIAGRRSGCRCRDWSAAGGCGQLERAPCRAGAQVRARSWGERLGTRGPAWEATEPAGSRSSRSWSFEGDGRTAVSSGHGRSRLARWLFQRATEPSDDAQRTPHQQQGASRPDLRVRPSDSQYTAG